MKFRTFVFFIAGAGLCWVIWLVGSWLFCQWIEPGNVGVIYDANHGLENKTYQPQRIFPGFRRTLYQYPTTIETAIYSQDPTLGEERAADGIKITTKDNANTVFDVVVVYQVEKQDVIKVVNTFGFIDIKEIQSTNLRRAIKDAVNVVGPNYDVYELMGPKRLEAAAAIKAELVKIMQPAGITILDILLGSCYPDTSIQQRIQGTVNAYTQLRISQINAEIADVDRQIATKRAEADTQAQNMKVAQVSGIGLEMLNFEADKAAIEAWNGHLSPLNNTKPGQTFFVDPSIVSTLGSAKPKSKESAK